MYLSNKSASVHLLNYVGPGEPGSVVVPPVGTKLGVEEPFEESELYAQRVPGGGTTTEKYVSSIL